MPFECRQNEYFRWVKMRGVEMVWGDRGRMLNVTFRAYTEGALSSESMRQDLGHLWLKSGVNLMEQVI